MAVQKPQCTHFRRMVSASRPSGVSRMKSASWVCTGGYTFRVKSVLWLLALAALGVFAYAMWRWRERWREHRRSSEARMAELLAQARPPATRDATLTQQQLLFDAAAKTGDAGEPALSIELYARLLARFPQSPFAEQARSAIEAQKRKLAKA